MSDKHFFPNTAANELVPRYLRALVTANPHLALIEADRVVYDPQHNPKTVSIISGGGSGHEPGWSGYVGKGALAGAACGDIFASPTTKQVLAAMNAAPSDEGHILMITNYTGDKLHFGLAAERAKARGLCRDVAMVHLTDDVSIGRSRCFAVGRRGLPGHIIRKLKRLLHAAMKITGAAAARNYNFNKCVRIARAVNAQVVSIGSALDHCHVPGRQQNESLPKNVVVVGAGIHNEPGAEKISPFPPVADLIRYCLQLLCDPADTERYFVAFDESDTTVLMVNNYGGLSNLELGALCDETLAQLNTSWDVKPARILVGTFETSLNAPGFSISLCNLSAASKELDLPVAELLSLLDEPTAAVSWRNTTPCPQKEQQARLTSLNARGSTMTLTHGIVNPALLEAAIRAGCEAAILAEPDLTRWDTVLGDGDCGETVKALSEAIIRILDNGGAGEGSVVDFVERAASALDDMGGTLGAILGILLAAFTSALQKLVAQGCLQENEALFATALAQAVEALKIHTSAREGDRTVMDVLLPFAEDFIKTTDFHHAVRLAEQKANATRFLKARFGRATYVGQADGQELPDPGAWALYEWLSGVSRACQAFHSQ
ncbi:Dak1-domain-containing protein [Myriangium duriaei CBS 260.36]|uniref:Dak1-domain-containing protein n=1 Tax=Myriangium duriaei CBS 260.36 TaxID=1168546 RepID=A0A9P4IPV8_9PEZI|nr:Dak1-domain-containing protein [Myriangium duriaei CBS 260.36]